MPGIDHEPKILVLNAEATHYFERLADLCTLRRSYREAYFGKYVLYNSISVGQAESLINHAMFGTWKMLASMGYKQEATDIVEYFRERKYERKRPF